MTNTSYKTNFCYWSYQGAYLLLLPAIHQRRIMVTGRVSISSSSTSMVKTTHRHFNGDFGDQNLGSWWLWGNHQLGSGNLEHTECKRSEVQKNFTLILSSHALAVLKIYPYLCTPHSECWCCKPISKWVEACKGTKTPFKLPLEPKTIPHFATFMFSVLK